MWLLRIDEATYLLIEGLGPQEANLYCDESEAMKAFRRTTAITYSCPLSPFRSHTFSPEWKHGERRTRSPRPIGGGRVGGDEGAPASAGVAFEHAEPEGRRRR